MTSVHAAPGSVVVIQRDGVDDFATHCPGLYDAVVEASAFVNWRRLEQGDPAVLALSFYESVPRS